MFTEWMTLLLGIVLSVVVWMGTKHFFSKYGESLKLD